MPDDSLPPDDPRFASGSGPVPVRQRRLLRANQAEQAESLAPEAARRRERLMRRHERPNSLAALQPLAQPPAPVPARAVLLGLSGLGLAAGAALALQGAAMLLALGAAVALLAACAFWVIRSHRSAAAEPQTAPAVEAEWLERLDAAMANAMPELDAELGERLAACHAAMMRALGLADALDLPDRLYLAEAVRRYLPDALAAFRAVPAAHRAQAPTQAHADGTPSARASLIEQLALLHAAFVNREAAGVARRAEAADRHRRFLAQKG